MAKKILLDSDIEAGKNLLKALDDGISHFKITTAMWFLFSENEEWKLLLFSPDFGKAKSPASIYTEISKVIVNSGGNAIDLEFIKIMLKNDPLLKILGLIAQVGGIDSIRMKSNYLNGIYIEDAFIYRNISS